MKCERGHAVTVLSYLNHFKEDQHKYTCYNRDVVVTPCIIPLPDYLV